MRAASRLISTPPDPDLNPVNVTNRVNQALAGLPPEVQRNGVTVKKQNSSIVLAISLTSPSKQYDGLFLSNYANLRLRDDLSRRRLAAGN